MRGCSVCYDPRDPRLSTSQIEWHNMGHPGLENLRRADTGSLNIVVVRPGDQILYEVRPGKRCRVDEVDVAVAASHGFNNFATACRRCFRRVLERRPTGSGFWRLRMENTAFKFLKKAG